MTVTPIPLDTRPLVAFVAAARLWLVELMAWLAGVLGVEGRVRAEIRAELRDLQHALAMLAFAQARTHFVLTATPRRSARPFAGPPGTACGRAPASLRLLWRIVPRGLGLKARCAALRRAIDEGARLVRRLVRALARDPVAAMVMTACAGDALDAQAAPGVCAADTS